MHKTTLVLDDQVFRQAKRLAVDLDKPLRVVVEEALRKYFLQLSVPEKVKKNPWERLPSWKAKLVGDLRRETIYSSYLDHKVKIR